jgi:hypothetical protein
MAELRRRCSAEPPDLSVACFNLTNMVSDPHNRIGRALHPFREPVPFGKNTLVFRPHAVGAIDEVDPAGSSCEPKGGRVGIACGRVIRSGGRLPLPFRRNQFLA